MQILEDHLQKQTEHSRDFFWHRLRWRAVRRFLPRERSFKLVDVGAGAGMVGEYMRDEYPRGEYHFVEPITSLETLLVSRHGSDRNARERTTYSGVEVVTLLDVLEHQKADRSFARELVARTVPGTTIVVTVPALQSLWSAWDEGLGHFRRYDKRTLLEAWRGLPAQVIELSYLFPEMIPAAAIRRFKQPGGTEGENAEFPNLPPVVNAALYNLGSVSLALRRLTPFGTSLLLALRRD